ncbi:ABC transporter permease, partial [Acinetobacter baumannii]
YLTSRVLPPPSAVAQVFWQTLNDGSLVTNTLVSTRRALLGLAIGGFAGFLLGVVNGAWAPARLALDSSMQMLRNVPHLAIIPLVILWFGIDEEAKVFLVAI